MSFDLKLLEKTLVCTKCHGRLVRDGDALVCIGHDCRLQFAILHEIPNMLLEEAIAASADDWSAVMQRAGQSK
jgi:uncharacterized protein YbaR (Trm112 family)